MKYKYLLPFFFLFTVLLMPQVLGAQNTPKSKAQEKWERKQAEVLLSLIKDVQLKLVDKFDKKKPCTDEAVYFIKNPKFNFDTTEIRKNVRALFDYYYGVGILLSYAKPNSFSKNSDFALSIISDIATKGRKLSFKEQVRKFIRDFTGKTRHQFSERTYKFFESYVSYMMNYRTNHIIFMESGASSKTKCIYKVRYILQLKKYNYPDFEWQLMAEYVKKCPCTSSSKPTDIKYLLAKYSGNVSSVFTSRGIQFSQQKNERYIYDLTCCKEKKSTEPSKSVPDPKPEKSSYLDGYDTGNEPISTTPKELIGGGIGLGVERSDVNTEFVFCASIDALRRSNIFNLPQGYAFYVGADGSFGISTSEFVKRNMWQLGPKVQLHKTLKRVGNLQWVNGLKALGITQDTESNGVKVPSSILDVNLFTGLQFPIGPKVFLGVEVPVISFISTETKPPGGSAYKNNVASLFINKENPLRVSLRLRR